MKLTNKYGVAEGSALEFAEFIHALEVANGEAPLALPAPVEPSLSTPTERAAEDSTASAESQARTYVGKSAAAADKRVEKPVVPMKVPRVEKPTRPLEVSTLRTSGTGRLTLERMVEAARAWFERTPGGTSGYCQKNGLNHDLTGTIVSHMVELMGGHRGRGSTGPEPELKAQWDEMTQERRLDLAQRALERPPRGSGTARSGATSTG